MPGLVLGVVATLVLSFALSCPILRRRCRGIGPPFGRHARWWALVIVAGTAVLSTAVGLLIVAATRHSGAVYVGIIVPAVLWFAKIPPQRDLEVRPRTWAHLLTLPFSGLYDQIGEDQHDWCQRRMAAATPDTPYIGQAVEYYWHQMNGVTDPRTRDIMDGWRRSITHRINIIRLIELDASPARLRAAFQQHPCTQHIREFTEDDLPRLARRLQSDAESELNLFLARAYQLGYHKMLIYPFRPEAHRHPPENPAAA